MFIDYIWEYAICNVGIGALWMYVQTVYEICVRQKLQYTSTGRDFEFMYEG
jgi:hypothetical protein